MAKQAMDISIKIIKVYKKLKYLFNVNFCVIEPIKNIDNE